MNQRQPPIDLKGFYSDQYRSGERDDSPFESRQGMISSMVGWMLNHPEGGRLLDIGSGPQALEGDLRIRMLGNSNLRGRISQYPITTFDLSSIPQNRLLHHKKKPLQISHFQADATSIPIDNESISLAVSNLAIDFAGRTVYSEVSRILRTDGDFIFHFHHPFLWHDIDLDSSIGEVQKFWKFLRDNNILFSSQEEIERTLSSQGLAPSSIDIINLQNRGFETERYWRVIGTKR